MNTGDIRAAGLAAHQNRPRATAAATAAVSSNFLKIQNTSGKWKKKSITLETQRGLSLQRWVLLGGHCIPIRPHGKTGDGAQQSAPLLEGLGGGGYEKAHRGQRVNIERNQKSSDCSNRTEHSDCVRLWLCPQRPEEPWRKYLDQLKWRFEWCKISSGQTH